MKKRGMGSPCGAGRRALACFCLGGGGVQASVCAREGVGRCVVRHQVGLGVAWAEVTAVRTLKS